MKNLTNDTPLVVTSLTIKNVLITAPQNVSYTLTLPTNDGSPNQVLTTNGNGVLSWQTGSALPGAGTVTSVSATVPAFLSISGSPITTSGTLTIGLSGTALPVANGGSGVTTSTGTGSNVLSNGATLTGNLKIVN